MHYEQMTESVFTAKIQSHLEQILGDASLILKTLHEKINASFVNWMTWDVFFRICTALPHPFICNHTLNNLHRHLWNWPRRLKIYRKISMAR